MTDKKLRASKSHSASRQRNPAHRQAQAQGPVFDDRLLGLVIDSLATVQTALMSASEQVPYTALRPFMAASEQEKRELVNATQAVAAKHVAFFITHNNAMEVAAVFTSVTAMKLDNLFSVLDQYDGSSPTAQGRPTGGHICSPREALSIALVVLAPLGILAIALLFQHFRRK